MNEIKVSVVIPIYNGIKYLEKCINSIVSQTIDGLEIICIDDGSSDGSYEALLNYAKGYKNIIVIKQKNQGAGSARNKGIDCAKGQFVHFMDADDYYPNSHVLERMYKSGISNSALIVGGRYLIHRNGNVIVAEEGSDCFEQEGFIEYRDFQESYWHWRYLFNTELLRNNAIEYPLYRRYQDPPFLVKAMIKAGKFYAIPEAVYVYRMGNRIIKYPINVLLDILSGMRDVLELAYRNELYQLKKLTLENFQKSFECKAEVYSRIYDENMEVLDLVHNINDLCGEAIISVDVAKQNVENAKLYKEEIEKRCQGKRVLIYGAGTVGKRVFKVLKVYSKAEIIGYAVTNGNTYLSEEGIFVKEVNDYLPLESDVLIIIATRKELQEEIIKYIDSSICGEKCIWIVDSEKIDILYSRSDYSYEL